MAQPLTRRLIADLDRLLDLPEPVVEFGSMHVEPDQNGDMRSLFRDREFIGTDMREGPGVDRIEDLRSLSLGDGEVGTALCLDTLEHCEDPVRACQELSRITAEGGVAIIASVMLFGVHAYPNDYFRFTPEGFRSMLSGFDAAEVGWVGDPDIPFQVFGVGTRGRDLDLSINALPSVKASQTWWENAPGRIKIGPFRYPPRELAKLLSSEAGRYVRRRLARH